jgi:ABC-type dipeptide/oligopeptide/nickel transport system ATPase component
MRAATGASVLVITHDMGVVAEICQRVMVMFDGRLVEVADVEDLFRRPLHPYTIRLLRATPGTAIAGTPAGDPTVVDFTSGDARPARGPHPEGEGGVHRVAALADVGGDDPLVALREVGAGHLVLCR